MTYEKILSECRQAARELRSAETEKRNRVLRKAALLLVSGRDKILAANAKDLKSLPKSATPAFRDRLMLDEKRLSQMAESLRQVAELPDPLNEVVENRVLHNGLRLRRVRAPLGVILMIFESRPNVATEAFSLAFKSGNVIILRGGKESMGSTGALYQILSQAIDEEGMNPRCFWGITDPDRKLTNTLLKQRKWIDIVVPRGGDSLIEFVVKNSDIPIIKNDRGLCHVYVDKDADPEMAVEILVNAKVSRPGVCNSMETMLIHEKLKHKVIPAAYEKMSEHHVKWYCCPETRQILNGKPLVHAAKKNNWDTEYLDYCVNCRVVKNMDEALAHIETHGSRHSEAIVTASGQQARFFQSEVDAAAVYWNASTRFTDGFEFGLGGELGISTQKLHVRGPVGLRELTNLRWIIDGEGQVRKT